MSNITQPEPFMSYKDEIKYLHRKIVYSIECKGDTDSSSEEQEFLLSLRLIVDTVLQIITGLIGTIPNTLNKDRRQDFLQLPPPPNNLVDCSSDCTILQGKIIDAMNCWLSFLDEVRYILNHVLGGASLLNFPDMWSIVRDDGLIEYPAATAIDEMERLGNPFRIRDQLVSLFHCDDIPKKNKDYVHFYKVIYGDQSTDDYKNSVAHPNPHKELYITAVACILNPNSYGALFSAQPKLAQLFCCLPDWIIEDEFISHAATWVYTAKHTRLHYLLVDPKLLNKIVRFMADPDARQPLLRNATAFRNRFATLDQLP